MSLLPLLLNELAEYRRQPSLMDLCDQNFGVGILNDDVLSPATSILMNPLRSGYMRPWRSSSLDRSGVSTIKSDKEGLKINLDVQQFKPEELKVSVEDGYVVVSGKHEERSDQHGFVSRQFTRRYKLPANVDEATLVSSLSSDGVLTLKAPPKVLPESKSRTIPITHTHQPAVKSGTECEAKPVPKTANQAAGDKMEQ